MPRVLNPPKLINSQPKARKALFAIESKFKKEPLVKQQYTDFMDEYESLNHMEVVCKSDDELHPPNGNGFLKSSPCVEKPSCKG